MKHPLKNIVEAQKKGIPKGIYSACTANALVLEAVMERAMKDGEYVLTTKTRTLGTYIVAEAPAAVADEAAEVPAEDGKAVPDTGR